MAIGVRDITNLEELLEVQDDDKIIVIQNGEAKLVSKANAKFGGGTVTVFYADPNDNSSYMKRLVDVNGNPISAQAAYDAVMSGPVHIFSPYSEIENPYFYITVMFTITKINEEIASVVFMAIDYSRKVSFYAGTNPNGGNS